MFLNFTISFSAFSFRYFFFFLLWLKPLLLFAGTAIVHIRICVRFYSVEYYETHQNLIIECKRFA